MKKIKKFIKDNKTEILCVGVNWALTGFCIVLANKLTKTEDELKDTQYKLFLLNDENARLHHYLDNE